MMILMKTEHSHSDSIHASPVFRPHDAEVSFVDYNDDVPGGIPVPHLDFKESDDEARLLTFRASAAEPCNRIVYCCLRSFENVKRKFDTEVEIKIWI